MKIVKNKELLRKGVNSSELTQETINTVSSLLEKSLRRFGGIGMSANQLNLPYRACIINVKEPLILINPRIVETSEESVVYRESCLSIPRTMRSPVNTIRYKTFTVECDNLGTVYFSPDKDNWDTPEDFWNDEGMLECVVAQHELDHLNGILITDIDRRYNRTYRSSTPSRNEKVMVRLEDGSTEFVKYKFVMDNKGKLKTPFVEIL